MNWNTYIFEEWKITMSCHYTSVRTAKVQTPTTRVLGGCGAAGAPTTAGGGGADGAAP